jgi:hypothetical protein
MFYNSFELATKVYEEDLEYFIDLICLNGRYPEFLKVFETIAKTYEINPSNDISKKLLSTILIDEKIHLIDVKLKFFKHLT